MMPNNRLTSTPVKTEFLYNKPDTKLIDRALGGIALQDTSEGYEYQVWEIYYENGKIKIRGLTTLISHELLEIENVTELSLAFDLSMNVSFTYVANNLAYLRFYDAFTQTFTTIPLTDCRSPRMAYDDYRPMQTNSSDIICAYINKNTLKLCCRISRDRFSIEYPLVDVQLNSRLLRVGMTTGLRLQFKMSLI